MIKHNLHQSSIDQFLFIFCQRAAKCVNKELKFLTTDNNRGNDISTMLIPNDKKITLNWLLLEL